jgi:phage tail sheath protein FI
MALGTPPAVIVSGTGTTDRSAGFGVGRSLTLRVQVYDNNNVAQFASPKDFVIPAGTAEKQVDALRSVIGGSLDADKVGVFDDGLTSVGGLGLSGAIVGSFAGSGASLGVSACIGTAFDAVNGIQALRGVYAPSSTNATFGVSGAYASAVRVYGASLLDTGSNSVAYRVQSQYPGAGYNGGIKTNGDTSGNSITIEGLGSQNFNVVVNENGTAQETFKVSFVGSGSFIEDRINTGATNVTSEIIKGNLVKDDVDANASELTSFVGNTASLVGSTGFVATSKWLDPGANPQGTGNAVTIGPKVVTDGVRFNKLIQAAATNLTGGTSLGAVDSSVTETQRASALIGDASVDPKTGMQALDDDVLNVGIALVPGIYNQDVQNNLITLAETTQNFLALVAPPYAVGTAQDAIDWTNGKSSSTAGSRSSAINSSYAAGYYPQVKVCSTFDGKDRWYDPTIFAARQMAYTDAVSDSWFAPAGFRRGRLSKPTEVEVKLNQGDRDSLYSGGNVVNPIVSFPQQGITIFGQRTAQRSPTALDRINVRRLMIYIRKVILIAARRFVFEPNDEFTWAQIEGLLNPFLDDIRRRRGITEFRVVCDETVNTPVRVDRNELWTKVLVKPTKTAEILIFEINITNQSAQLGSL